MSWIEALGNYSSNFLPRTFRFIFLIRFSSDGIASLRAGLFPCLLRVFVRKFRIQDFSVSVLLGDVLALLLFAEMRMAINEVNFLWLMLAQWRISCFRPRVMARCWCVCMHVPLELCLIIA